jgi:hypothetical protein
MKQNITFNINDHVFIRLTELGKKYVKETCGRLPSEDGDGWSQWQLWDVMSTFGEHIHLGCEPLFQTNIRIPVRIEIEAG